MQQDQVREALYQLPHRQIQQDGRRRAVQPEGDEQAGPQGQQKVQHDIKPRPEGAGLFEQIEAHMPALVPGLLHQLACQHVFLHAPPFGQLFQPFQVFPPGTAVHLFKDRVLRQDLPAAVRPAQQLLHVQHREQPQGSEQPPEGLGAVRRVGDVTEPAAHIGDAFDDGAAQGGGEQLQLPPGQHCHRLKALQKGGAALLRHLALPGLYQHPAQFHDHDPLRGAAQVFCRFQLGGGVGVFPLHHVPVVQQPLAGRRSPGQLSVAFLHRLMAAADLQKIPAQQGGGLGPGTVVLGPQQHGGGGGVIQKPSVLNIRA